MDVAPDPRNTAVTAVEVEFSEEIVLTSLDQADVTLTAAGWQYRSRGHSDVRAGPRTNRYRIIGLGTLTQPDGTTCLTVSGAGVRDVAGNFGIGSASDAWLNDTTAPTTGLSPASGTYLLGTTFTWHSADERSGVASTRVEIDGLLVSTANAGTGHRPRHSHRGRHH